MPVGGPDAPMLLTPPQTRVLQAFNNMKRGIFVNNAKRLQRARATSTMIRSAGAKR